MAATLGGRLRALLAWAPNHHQALIDIVRLDERLAGSPDAASRAVISMALNIALLGDLLDRTPTAAAYVRDLRRAGRDLVFDHGAVRTVALDGMGDLPGGVEAIGRILEPLGYLSRSIYPLSTLRMTGWSFTHADFPDLVPQFFVSELHVDQFSAPFQAAARRVTAGSISPLDSTARRRLGELGRRGSLPWADAATLVRRLAPCFARQHPTPAWSDYQLLLAESAEMAWIATEGNAFNHATDRVASVSRVADAQRSLGRPVKPKIEVSSSGRVRQTALRADLVERTFLDGTGRRMIRSVPGSFFEFIERDQRPEGGLDLRFDSANAQGIFKMTQAVAA